LVIVKEGAMDITIDGTTHKVGTGSIAYVASNAMQSMKNSGEAPATYYVISVTSAATPKPTDS
jgi:mannose-6-phosphate isomerase-like protein (cupin superfamily)